MSPGSLAVAKQASKPCPTSKTKLCPQPLCCVVSNCTSLMEASGSRPLVWAQSGQQSSLVWSTVPKMIPLTYFPITHPPNSSCSWPSWAYGHPHPSRLPSWPHPLWLMGEEEGQRKRRKRSEEGVVVHLGLNLAEPGL